MSFFMDTVVPETPEMELSKARAAQLLGINPKLLSKGLAGGTIPDLRLVTIASLATRPVISRLEFDGHPVPVLRSGSAIPEDSDERQFFGWQIDASISDTTVALDRWWVPQGRDGVLAAGGYLVAVGSVVCAVLQLESQELVENEEGRIRYDATMAGLLRSDGEVVLDERGGDWVDLARQCIGLRVVGGEGGNFTRIGAGA